MSMKGASTGFEDFTRQHRRKGSSDRSFGLVMAAFFTLVGLMPLRHQAPPRVWALVLSGVLLAVAIGAPALLRPLNRLWFRLGLLLQRVGNPIVLGLLFALVITPVAFVTRLLGRDPLRIKPEPGAPSYWIPRVPPGPPPETLARQF